MLEFCFAGSLQVLGLDFLFYDEGVFSWLVGFHIGLELRREVFLEHMVLDFCFWRVATDVSFRMGLIIVFSIVRRGLNRVLGSWTYYLMDLAYQPKNSHSCCVASWETMSL